MAAPIPSIKSASPPPNLHDVSQVKMEISSETKSKSDVMDNAQASFWLSQFIGKNLRIHTSDNRIFGGQMKCTDKVWHSLILLQHASCFVPAWTVRMG